MPIEKQEGKIHFVEYIPHQKAERDAKKESFTASIDVKSGYLRLGKPAIAKMNLDGKFVKFYFEPSKKIIGWKIKDSIGSSKEELSLWKPIIMGKKVQAILGIRGILSQFVGVSKENYKGLEIKHYKDYGPLADGEELYYVKLK